MGPKFLTPYCPVIHITAKSFLVTPDRQRSSQLASNPDISSKKASGKNPKPLKNPTKTLKKTPKYHNFFS